MDILFDCYRAICFYVLLNYRKTYFCKVGGNVGNFPFAARVLYRSGVSGDDFWQLARTHGSQHRCSVDRAEALKDWQGVSDVDFDGADDRESTTILQASGRGICCD